MASGDKIKEAIREVTKNLESGVDQVVKIRDHVQNLMEETKGNFAENIAQITEDMKRHVFNQEHEDLDGKLLYIVHFVEYINGIQVTDIPVFFGTTPEWAVGFCKAHTNYAAKFENDKKRWWYFYIDEAAINDKLGGRGWLMVLDWNGNISKDTFHFDKGYDFNYQREKVMLNEQDPCDACKIVEVDEQERDAKRTLAALNEANIEIKKYFLSVEVINKIEGDWHKIIVQSPNFPDNFVDHYVYDIIFNKYGVGVGNNILIYFQKSAKTE
jgi:hypothetical protein